MLPALPPVVANLEQLPPLSFQGFRAGMLVGEAADSVRANHGALSCKPTRDPRMRDCTGTLQLAGLPRAEILISSVHDSAAVIVLSFRGTAKLTEPWLTQLMASFGTPNQRNSPGRPRSWQWIRKGTMLTIVERRSAATWETSVTLTFGPLLDGLGG